jgi:hypothetical protein
MGFEGIGLQLQQPMLVCGEPSRWGACRECGWGGGVAGISVPCCWLQVLGPVFQCFMQLWLGESNGQQVGPAGSWQLADFSGVLACALYREHWPLSHHP